MTTIELVREAISASRAVKEDLLEGGASEEYAEAVAARVFAEHFCEENARSA